MQYYDAKMKRKADNFKNVHSSEMKHEIRNTWNLFRKAFNKHKLECNSKYIKESTNISKASWKIVNGEIKNNVKLETDISVESFSRSYQELPATLINTYLKSNVPYETYLFNDWINCIFFFSLSRNRIEIEKIIMSLKSSGPGFLWSCLKPHQIP